MPKQNNESITSVLKNIFFANGVKCDSEQFLIEDLTDLIRSEITKAKEEAKKDYIVVKTVEEAESLVKIEPAPKSLRGKWIIIAPNGLKFVSKEDIEKLPQIKSLLSQAKEKAVEEYKQKVLEIIGEMVDAGGDVPSGKLKEAINNLEKK